MVIGSQRNEQWCDAQAQYDTYMSLLASPQVEPTAVYAADKCTEQPQIRRPSQQSSGAETPTPTATLPAEPTPSPVIH